MNYKTPILLDSEIIDLEEHINKFIANEISAVELKHHTAPFGIYEQKNQKFMVRIRCTAGIISPSQLKTVALISEKFAGKEFHITTRQQLQIHDVPPENIITILKKLKNVNLAFRGGGGNTLRNVIASPDSGISANEVFDVAPHAVAVSNKLIIEENSFKLPRKLKIAFSNSDDDDVYARCTDLGFIAAIKDGRKGFKVYVAGGFGRNPQSGNLLHDFILEEKIHFVAEAVKTLFDKYGNREKRSQARLRFLWISLGKEKFIELYNEELANVKNTNPKTFTFSEIENRSKEKYSLDKKILSSEKFGLWKKRYVHTQKQPGLFSVDIPLLFGNIKNENAVAIADLISNFSENTIRFTLNQNIMLRNIPEMFLGNIYELISKITPLADKPRLVGNCIACTGSAICKIGIARPRELLKALDKKLEQSDLPLDNIPDLKIHLSGCPNSCAQHHVADLGFAGKIKSENGERKFWFSVFENAEVKNDLLHLAKETTEIPEEKVVDYIIGKLEGVKV
ncbi:nitrite/sulfite reductase [bacterium]|nr:nitrite/sulfite reductase [bacterium]